MCYKKENEVMNRVMGKGGQRAGLNKNEVVKWFWGRLRGGLSHAFSSVSLDISAFSNKL
jgi:hypothetical protein